VEEIPLRVIKKDGRRVPFDRNKILAGLLKACEKTPVAAETLEKVVQDIEAEINERGDTEVESRQIGEMVMQRLRELNQIAYVRFASVYREFRDINQFNQFLEDLRPLLEKKKTDGKT
jgi:transcriptional repressor NrdR